MKNPIDIIFDSKYTDKFLHFGVGALIVAFAGVVIPLPYAFALTALAGIAKEIYDKRTGNGTPEVLDFVATLLGGAIAALTMYWLN